MSDNNDDNESVLSDAPTARFSEFTINDRESNASINDNQQIMEQLLAAVQQLTEKVGETKTELESLQLTVQQNKADIKQLKFKAGIDFYGTVKYEFGYNNQHGYHVKDYKEVVGYKVDENTPIGASVSFSHEIPKLMDFTPADGRVVWIKDYPELSKVIDNSSSNSNTTFKLPTYPEPDTAVHRFMFIRTGNELIGNVEYEWDSREQTYVKVNNKKVNEYTYVGTIGSFTGDIPDNWTKANGSMCSYFYDALFKVIGFRFGRENQTYRLPTFHDKASKHGFMFIKFK